VRIRAVEQWLDEGWSPWRIGYGTITLVATVVAVYGYISQQHHPGAVWWLLAALSVITGWSLSEMMRWRVKYKRLQATTSALASERASKQRASIASREANKAARLRKLYGDGRVLKSTISHYTQFEGDTLPYNEGYSGGYVEV